MINKFKKTKKVFNILKTFNEGKLIFLIFVVLFTCFTCFDNLLLMVNYLSQILGTLIEMFSNKTFCENEDSSNSTKKENQINTEG